jgi:leucyl aminopeptidase
MNITFSPVKGATQIDLLVGDTSKVVEDKLGTVGIKIGIGKADEVTRRKLILIARKVIKLAREHKQKVISIAFTDFQFKKAEINDYRLGRLLAEAFEMANYEFTKYKTPPKDGFASVDTLYVDGATADAKKGFTDGQIIAREVNFCRDLANTPGGDMTPEILADAAEKQLKGTKATVTVLGPAEIKKLKMGLILSVDQGSAQPPRFIIAEYWGAGKGKEDPIVLVGKGITFDTGGINLKPSAAMVGMNQDMAGGAAVIGTVAAAARLGLKKNIVALVPAVENAISGSATRPGDIATAMNGKTVEILNTDAEGRLILGDALTYAERYNPRLVVDVATLTGAAITVVGKRASVIMTPQQKLEDLLRHLGELSGEYVWPLPLWDEYTVDTKGIHADLANVPPGEKSVGAGAIMGGMFLKHFAGKFPHWAHIDIAPRMEAIPEDNLSKGATGTPIRLLIRVIEEFQG